MSDYRQRIYARYASGRQQANGGDYSAEVAARDPYFQVLVRDYFPADKGAVIRELGAGQGVLLRVLEEHGYRDVIGYDVSPEQNSRSLALKSARLECKDFREALDASPDDSVDVAVAFDLLEHLTRDEAIQLADGVFRVLKPGGRWIIHCPNGESPFSGRIRYGDLTHEMAYTRQSIAQLLHLCGFTAIVCREDQPTVHGLLSAARWILWRAIRSSLRFYIAVETGFTGSEIILSQNFLTLCLKPNSEHVL